MSGAERTVTVASYLVLAAVGVMLGTIEAFLVPQRIFGGVEGLSVVLAVVGNLAVGLLGGIGTRSVIGTVMPVAGWFVAVGFVSAYAPGGDVVLPGRLPGDPGVTHVTPAMMILGILAGAAALLVISRYTRRAERPTHST